MKLLLGEELILGLGILAFLGILLPVLIYLVLRRRYAAAKKQFFLGILCGLCCVWGCALAMLLLVGQSAAAYARLLESPVLTIYVVLLKTAVTGALCLLFIRKWVKSKEESLLFAGGVAGGHLFHSLGVMMGSFWIWVMSVSEEQVLQMFQQSNIAARLQLLSAAESLTGFTSLDLTLMVFSEIAFAVLVGSWCILLWLFHETGLRKCFVIGGICEAVFLLLPRFLVSGSATVGGRIFTILSMTPAIVCFLFARKAWEEAEKRS